MHKIGLLFGMEDSFPWALIEAINKKGGKDVQAAPVELSAIQDVENFPYGLILDRISHEVPFYRSFLKVAVARGIRVINNPFWSAADDKFFNNIVALACKVAVPKTVLLPHKAHPPNTQATTFRNMKFVDWDKLYDYLGFPIFMKPAYGGGWKDVYKCDNALELHAAYDKSRDLAMMAQEAIDFKEYYRCYVLGRSRVRLMRYDPKQYFHLRYVVDPPPIEPRLKERMEKDCLTLCKALGYDMNTVEFAIRDGIPIAIDFMNGAPDADIKSVGEENFRWVIDNMADVLIEKVKAPSVFQPTGTWPEVLLRKGV